MMSLSGLFVVTTCLLTIGSAGNDISTASNYGKNLADVYSYIGSALEDRPTFIEVEVEEFQVDDINVLTSSEGLKTYGSNTESNYDYEMYNIKSLKYTKSVQTKKDGSTTYKIMLFPTYRESKEESEYVFNTVADIIASDNQVRSYSKEEQYEWIYDYILEHVSYDYTYNNKTAYAALTEGSTICGGYSSLFYAFAKELGLSCRIAYGNTTGGYHAWNLVKLNGEWYYTDSTMGDNQGYHDTYILKAKNSISTHQIESGFVDDFAFANSDYAFN